MEPVRAAQKKYCSQAMVAAILIGFVFILAGQKPVCKGLILGTLFSVVNFILMAETLPVRLGKSKRKATLLSLGSILFRYMLMGVPLYLALKMDQFHLIATICGLFMVQAVILADHLITAMYSAPGKRV